MVNQPEQPEAWIGRQPNLQIVAQGPASPATSIDSTANVPALDQDDQIMYILHLIRQDVAATQQEMAALLQDVAAMRQELVDFRYAECSLQIQTALRLQEVLRQGKNSIARAINRSADHNTSVLEPLFGLDGNLVPNFPATLGDAMTLNHATIHPILVSLGLATTGGLRRSKARLYRFIGLAYER